MAAQAHHRPHATLLAWTITLVVSCIVGSAVFAYLQATGMADTSIAGDHHDARGSGSAVTAVKVRLNLAPRAAPVGHDGRTENPHACQICGVVDSIRPVSASLFGKDSDTTPGTPNASGLWNGKRAYTAMTIIDANGGIYTGHIGEANPPSSTTYLIEVRMEDGTYQSFFQYSTPHYTVGDPVRVVSGRTILI